MTKGKKKTVPVSSVAADGEQSRTKNSDEIIANTHKTSEYVKLQTGMFTEIRTKNLNNNDLPII